MNTLRQTSAFAFGVTVIATAAGVLYEPLATWAAITASLAVGYLLGVLVAMKMVVGDLRRRRGAS